MNFKNVLPVAWIKIKYSSISLANNIQFINATELYMKNEIRFFLIILFMCLTLCKSLTAVVTVN